MDRKRLLLSLLITTFALALVLSTLVISGLGHTHAASPSPTSTTKPQKAIKPPVSSIVQDKIYYGDDGKSIYALNITTGTLLWHYKKNASIQFTSLMTVSSGKVFLDLFGNVGANGANLVVALNATSGLQLWAISIAGYGPPISSSFAATGLLYFYIWAGGTTSIYALRISDGILLWTNAADSMYVGSQGVDYLNAINTVTEPVQWACAVNAITGSTLWCYQHAQIVGLGQGVVYATVLDWNNPSARAVIAIRTTDGSLLWSYSGPSLATFAGDSVYALTYNPTTQSSSLCALSASAGTARWCDSYISNSNGSKITVANGIVYVDYMPSSPLQVFRASDGKPLWTANAGLLFVDRGVAYLLDWPSSGNVTLIAHRDHASNVLWQRSLGTGNGNSGCQFPVIGILYCTRADAHIIYAFNTANGNLLWKHSFEGTATFQTVASGIAYITTFITFNEHNGIGSHALDARSGKLLWSIWHYAP